MIGCEEALARLDDYIDGELNESDAHAVAVHLEQCPECRAEETALRGLFGRSGWRNRLAQATRMLAPQRLAAVVFWTWHVIATGQLLEIARVRRQTAPWRNMLNQ